MADIDLDALFQQGVVSVNTEHPDEREARLRIKEADATAARFRENIKFGSFCMLLIAFIAGSAYVAITRKSDPILQQWSLATLTTVISASLGYLVGERKTSQLK